MKCPHCRLATTDVFNSRPTKFGNQIWRRRRCLACHESFTTYEVADLGFISVTTKPGRRPERYSRAKLFASIYDAFLPSSGQQAIIDAVTDTVEAKLLDAQSQTMSTHAIMVAVLQTLRHFNTAAYVRYLTDQTPVTNEAELRKALKKY